MLLFMPDGANLPEAVKSATIRRVDLGRIPCVLPELVEEYHQIVISGPSDRLVLAVRQIRQMSMAIVIALTDEHCPTTAMVELFQSGADDVISQTTSPLEFDFRVRARSRFLLQTRLDTTLGDLSFPDCTSCLFTATGDRVELTVMEAMLLRYLTKHAGVLLTKERLMEHLYGHRPLADQPQPKIIDVYLCRLKKKLAALTSLVTISSSWGRGVMLIIESATEQRYAAE